METPTPKRTKSRRRATDDSRAERKRIQDRLAQRATRERTKNRIASLEQRLGSLEAGDRQGEITNLTRMIDSLRNDNNRLRNALVKMRTFIDQAVHSVENEDEAQSQPCGCSNQANCTCQQGTFVESPSATFEDPTSGVRHHSESSEATEVISGNPGLNAGVELPDPVPPESLQDCFDFSPNTLLEMFEFGPPTGYNGWQSQPPSPFDYRFPSADATLKVAPDLLKWETSNSAFTSCLDSVKKRTVATATLDMHVPFKAAIWGWDNVGPEAHHPIWSALRKVDQKVFGSWTSKAQRIALMYVCQTLIQWRGDPTTENLNRVPVFLRPRPSQEQIQHPAVIDFLIWPGLRDRLVFEHQKYTATGRFSAAFVEGFHFNWPFSERDIFAYNPTTHKYEVSTVFLEYAYNFKNWTMKPAFFRKFPEMQHDIPVLEDPSDLAKANWST